MGLKEDMKRKLANRPPVPWKVDPSILLHPQIPQPMHGLAPRLVCGNSWWDRERKAAYASNHYHCLGCGVHKSIAKSRQWLEAHETYKIDYLKGRMTYLRSVPLCHYCHNYIHQGRLRMLLEKGEVHQAKYVAIIQHGDAIIAAAGLIIPEPYNGPIAEWSKWRLVVGRKQYKPLFKSYEDWCEHWGREPMEEE